MSEKEGSGEGRGREMSVWLKRRGGEGAENLRRKQHRKCVCVGEERTSAGLRSGS